MRSDDGSGTSGKSLSGGRQQEQVKRACKQGPRKEDLAAAGAEDEEAGKQPGKCGSI